MIRNAYSATLILIYCNLVILSDAQPPPKSASNIGDFNTLHRDGSYEFGYNNEDEGGSYHISQADRANVVRGRFGSRDPGTKLTKETVYTAGPRGFRARGPNVHRKMDLDQRPRGPIGNKDDPYFDPNEDPSYSFAFKTPTYEKQEAANRLGDVTGRYTYVDDVGERHNVEYIAGKTTGFHVRTAFPDSPQSIGPLYYNRPLVKAEKKPRGHSSIQRGLDGSYRFVSAGPDQRRTESSDANGNVRGSYTFLDDKGVQRTVHYIAGPGIGYRVIKNSPREPFIPAFSPVLPDYRDPNLDKPFPPRGDEDLFPPGTFPSKFPPPKEENFDDLFGGPGGSAASGHVKPPSNNRKPPTNNRKPGSPGTTFDSDKNDLFDKDDEVFDFDFDKKPDASGKPSNKPPTTIDSDFGSQGEGKPVIYGENNGDDDDLFGGPPIGVDKDVIKPDLDGDVNLNQNGPGSSFDKPKPDDSGDEDDLFGPPGGGSKPSGGRPSNGRPPYGRPPRPGNGRPQGGRPTNGNRPGGGRPTNGNRPGGGRPSYGESKPDNGDDDSSIFGESGSNDIGSTDGAGSRPDSGRPGGGRPSRPGRPGYRPGRPGTRPGRPGRPGSRPTSSYSPDDDSSGSKPGIGDSGDKKPSDNDIPFISEGDDDLFGPPSGPPTSSSGSGFPGGPPDRIPSSKPDTSSGFDEPGSIDINRPIDIPDYTTTRPVIPTIIPDDGSYKPQKPIGPPSDSGSSSGGSSPGDFLGSIDDEDIFPDEKDKGGPNKEDAGPSGGTGIGPSITITGHRDKHRGGTIFRNLGDESIHFPPGASVRAHVQSIDLLPFGSKSKSPAEAVEDELKQHGSR